MKVLMLEEDCVCDESVLLVEVEVEVEQRVWVVMMCLAVEDWVEVKDCAKVDKVHRVGICSCLYYREPP